MVGPITAVILARVAPKGFHRGQRRLQHARPGRHAIRHGRRRSPRRVASANSTGWQSAVSTPKRKARGGRDQRIGAGAFGRGGAVTTGSTSAEWT